MKTTIKKLTLSVTAAVIAGPVLFGMSATAGDWGGGLKGMRGSYVPVPAPAPIPDFRPKWYLRADVGLGIGVDMKTSESGARYGGASTFAASGFNTDDGASYGHSIGIGAGYYYSRNFRVDVTGELRMEKESITTAGSNAIGVTLNDTTTLQSAIFMANGYYDMNRFGRWTPYVGGGLGFAVNDVRRTHTGTDGIVTNSSRTERQYVYTLAANASAGIKYQFTDVTSLDLNYRYLYVGGTDAMASINGNTSTIEIDDQHEHYIRVGLRFDIN